MKLTVNVTQKHINKGMPEACGQCPIALALNEQHPCRTLGWWVGDLIATGGAGRYRLPASATCFIRNFDAGRDVKPFAFELEEWG